MQKSFDALLHQFSRVRTGRASASILDDVRINYYGSPTPVKQLCNISIPEPRTIVVQPWDKTTLADIEKAILAANLGITPENDGNVIRLPFQPLTEEKRRDIVKNLKKLAEDARVAIRNIRREANDQAKKMEKDHEISEDEQKKTPQGDPGSHRRLGEEDRRSGKKQGKRDHGSLIKTSISI